MCEVHVYTTGCVINIREIKAERIVLLLDFGFNNLAQEKHQI